MFIKVLLEDKYVDDKDAETCKYLDVDMGDTIPYQDTIPEWWNENLHVQYAQRHWKTAYRIRNTYTVINTCRHIFGGELISAIFFFAEYISKKYDN